MTLLADVLQEAGLDLSDNLVDGLQKLVKVEQCRTVLQIILAPSSKALVQANKDLIQMADKMKQTCLAKQARLNRQTQASKATVLALHKHQTALMAEQKIVDKLSELCRKMHNKAKQQEFKQQNVLSVEKDKLLNQLSKAIKLLKIIQSDAHTLRIQCSRHKDTLLGLQHNKANLLNQLEKSEFLNEQQRQLLLANDQKINKLTHSLQCTRQEIEKKSELLVQQGTDFDTQIQTLKEEMAMASKESKSQCLQWKQKHSDSISLIERARMQMTTLQSDTKRHAERSQCLEKTLVLLKACLTRLNKVSLDLTFAQGKNKDLLEAMSRHHGPLLGQSRQMASIINTFKHQLETRDSRVKALLGEKNQARHSLKQCLVIAKTCNQTLNDYKPPHVDKTMDVSKVKAISHQLALLKSIQTNMLQCIRRLLSLLAKSQAFNHILVCQSKKSIKHSRHTAQAHRQSLVNAINRMQSINNHYWSDFEAAKSLYQGLIRNATTLPLRHHNKAMLTKLRQTLDALKRLVEDARQSQISLQQAHISLQQSHLCHALEKKKHLLIINKAIEFARHIQQLMLVARNRTQTHQHNLLGHLQQSEGHVRVLTCLAAMQRQRLEFTQHLYFNALQSNLTLKKELRTIKCKNTESYIQELERQVTTLTGHVCEAHKENMRMMQLLKIKLTQDMDCRVTKGMAKDELRLLREMAK